MEVFMYQQWSLNTLNLTPLWLLLIHPASQAVFTRCLYDSGDTRNAKTNMVVFLWNSEPRESTAAAANHQAFSLLEDSPDWFPGLHDEHMAVFIYAFNKIVI